ncbi:MAG: glucose-1-phosphate adenylyltransferase [Deltaproteobacteria bacterium]|nr:MAG: glucose-1-phosphate adenylyltransferase [Deltaproteobacteria bacterium]
MPERVVTVILGGGRGTRLYPLTAHRAKPAVPLGGKYRLIDIPVSNSINSGYRSVYVLTQFNSASLNRHVGRSFHFDVFSRGFVEILAAEQTRVTGDWFQGTADAVRKQLRHFDEDDYDHMLILAGDHLYRMDYRELVATHLRSGADVTVSTIAVDRRGCDGFGIVGVDDAGRVRRFREKPSPDEDLSALAAPSSLQERWGLGDRRYLASMGIYVFRRDALHRGLALPDAMDFGRDILPAMAETHHVQAHHFSGYWEDIGTINAFFEANLALCDPDSRFRFWDEDAPIYTRRRFLPASRVLDSHLDRCIITEGCLVEGARLERCVVGLRSRVQPGVRARDTIIMGADYYESDDRRRANRAAGLPDIGIGEGTVLERCIIDKNARIGAGCVLRGAPDRPDAEGDGWVVRDGIVVVGKNAVIPPGATI